MKSLAAASAFGGRHAAFLFVIVVAIGVRWCFLAGPAGSDDTRYMNAAARLAEWIPLEGLDHANVRGAFLAWLAAWCLVGVKASKLVYTQIAASAWQAAALFVVARQLTGSERSAVLAAGLWVVFPVELVFGGVLSPDQLGLALALSALGLAVAGMRNREAPTGWPWAVGAGVFSGLAYSAKEPFMLVPLVLTGWLVLNAGICRRSLVWCTALWLGFVAVVVAEHVLYQLWTGDWLYKYHALTRVYGAQGTVHFPVSPGRLLYYLRGMLADTNVAGLFGWLLLAGAIACGRMVQHRLLVALWTGAFYVFLQFGTSSVSSYKLLPMQPRYVGPIVILLFCLLGLAIHELSTKSVLRTWGTAALVAGILVQGVTVARVRLADGLYTADIPQSAIAYLDRRGPPSPVHVPVEYRTRLPRDLREAGTWQEVEIDEWLRAGGQRSCSPSCAVIVPVRWSSSMGGQESRARAVAELTRAGGTAESLSVPATPLDQLLATAPLARLRSWARIRTVAQVWLLPGGRASAEQPLSALLSPQERSD